MLPIHSKPVMIAAPTALVDNSAVTTTEVDTLGFDYASFYLYVGTTDIALTDLIVQETDTAGSGYSDIAATDFTSSSQYDVEGTALALPSATADTTWRVIHVNLVGRKRYLDLDITVGDGTAGGWYYAFCILSRAKAQPMTNAGLAGTDGIAVVC
jgi:hypothetical protein